MTSYPDPPTENSEDSNVATSMCYECFELFDHPAETGWHTCGYCHAGQRHWEPHFEEPDDA